MDARPRSMTTPQETELDALIRTHRLSPHPEGGYYREVYRTAEEVGASDGRRRHAVSVILFLIPGGIETRWHRVSSCEIWHHLGGAPILLVTGNKGAVEEKRLEGDPISLPGVVPLGIWQRARSLGDWSLASCTVAPAFDFRDFTLWEGDTLPADDSSH